MKSEVHYPTVVLADNLKCDVLKKTYKIFEDELFCGAYQQLLHAKTTSFLQPLNLGVMKPFK
ncbi:hypothetical protein H257_15416 [Aphanomyces astaci]|uniref:Uncharacterized protein n=1 Tax=Aphanomyces astaci TaxID=112090 RepID=W4FPM0_APHAT|nr:hypothetical protein H257_15416 [Aphanomyces astaci]ETV68603.1 hypothetical protein H257_15416 [Aphanomyces astaci]|eukprot:XP_009841828.1 hypothetical protein H257_15416 [Aphanomyces astaci]